MDSIFRHLAESNGRFYLLTSASSPTLGADMAVRDATCTLDPGGIVLSWDKGAEGLFGYSIDEALGQCFYHFCDPVLACDGSFERALSIAYSEGEADYRCLCASKDGGKFGAHVSVKPLWHGREFRGYGIIVQPDN